MQVKQYVGVVAMMGGLLLVGAGCPAKAPTSPAAESTQKTEVMVKDQEAAMMGAEESVMMKDGKMVVETKGGGVAMMEKDMTMSDGTKVMVDGKVMMKSGVTMMKEGDRMMMKDGKAVIESSAMMKKEGAAMQKPGTMTKTGDVAGTENEPATTPTDDEDAATLARSGYQPYEEGDAPIYAADAKVVLFFKAKWCPTCQALDKNIRANLSGIPENVTILQVDYDTATALKQKHGVTYQHTFVQVDPVSGGLIKKWSGGTTLSDVLGNVQ